MKVLLFELRRLLGELWVVLARFNPWVKSLLGRKTAGMYMGRFC